MRNSVNRGNTVKTHTHSTKETTGLFSFDRMTKSSSSGGQHCGGNAFAVKSFDRFTVDHDADGLAPFYFFVSCRCHFDFLYSNDAFL
jgi:hypothetical protein